MPEFCEITVLCDNNSLSAALEAEHGLSFHIATENGKILFDTGQSDVFLKNARSLHCPLEDLSAVVLSHGHYDHTGGLVHSGDLLKKAIHYFHPQLFIKRYRPADDGGAKEIGLPDPAANYLQSAALPFVHTLEPCEVLPGVHVTGTVPRHTPFEDRGGPFFLDPECTEADEIMDDQALWIDTEKGSVVLLGCAHAGTINTLDYIRDLTAGRPVHAVLGGMHLKSASEERMTATIRALRRYEIDLLAPCHCTGEGATSTLKEAFPHSFTDCAAGSRFCFPL